MDSSLDSDRISGGWFTNGLIAYGSYRAAKSIFGRRRRGEEPAPSYNKQDVEKLCNLDSNLTVCNNLQHLHQ